MYLVNLPIVRRRMKCLRVPAYINTPVEIKIKPFSLNARLVNLTQMSNQSFFHPSHPLHYAITSSSQLMTGSMESETTYNSIS